MPRVRSAHLSIAELEGLLESRRARVAKFEKQRARLARKLETLDNKIISLGGSAHVAAARGTRVGRIGRGGRAQNAVSLPETLVRVLAKQGGPMAVKDIVAAVRATGYRTTSDNFRAIVNQALIKDKRFIQASRGNYAMKKSA
jgi:hypothetical protein